jgi:hypothetical protein
MKDLTPIQLDNRILLITITAALAALVIGYGIGFIHGSFFQMKAANKKQKPCIGYTVLDVERVITCSGDTICLEWKQTPKK